MAVQCDEGEDAVDVSMTNEQKDNREYVTHDRHLPKRFRTSSVVTLSNEDELPVGMATNCAERKQCHQTMTLKIDTLGEIECWKVVTRQRIEEVIHSRNVSK